MRSRAARDVCSERSGSTRSDAFPLSTAKGIAPFHARCERILQEFFPVRSASMKKLIAMCVLVTPLVASGVFAQTTAPAATPAANAQQDKMKGCNAQASG